MPGGYPQPWTPVAKYRVARGLPDSDPEAPKIRTSSPGVVQFETKKPKTGIIRCHRCKRRLPIGYRQLARLCDEARAADEDEVLA